MIFWVFLTKGIKKYHTKVMESTPVQTVTTSPSSPPVSSSPQLNPQVNYLPYASFLRRLVAYIVDLLIVTLIMMVLDTALSLLIRTFEASRFMSFAGILTQLFFYPIWAIYSVYFIGGSGQTPGKKLLRIKVVQVGTVNRPGYFKAFLRETVGKALSSILYLGYLWMLWDDKKQCWHDKIAGTIVLKV